MTPKERRHQYYLANKEKWTKQYAYTPQAIERRREYNLTDAARASKRKYNRTDAGKVSQSKYCRTDKRRRDFKKFNDKLRFQKCGITEEIYEQMLLACGNKCQVCQSEFREREPHLDHCHKTGKARGLLCYRCNTAEGLLRADPEIIFRLYEYVRKHAP